MNKFKQYIKVHLRHQELVLISFLVGVSILFIPLQHYMPLARYQHYSFCLFSIALGFLAQASASWRSTSIWGRLTLLGSFAFTWSFAYYMFNNPWLGNPDLATDYQLGTRHVVVLLLLLAALPLAFVWARWGLELNAERAAPKGAGESKM